MHETAAFEGCCYGWHHSGRRVHLHLRNKQLGLQEDSIKLRLQIESLEQQLQAAKMELETAEVGPLSGNHEATGQSYCGQSSCDAMIIQADLSCNTTGTNAAVDCGKLSGAYCMDSGLDDSLTGGPTHSICGPNEAYALKSSCTLLRQCGCA